MTVSTLQNIVMAPSLAHRDSALIHRGIVLSHSDAKIGPIHNILTYLPKNGTRDRKVGSMKPVVTALQAIAAIERETREAEAPSASRSETILWEHLSESSLAFGNDRDGPTAPSACTEART